MVDWRFPDPRNLAVFTTRQVVRLGFPILFVTHDADDGTWQFLCGTTNDTADAMIVGLGEIVEIDSSVEELADLPPGWKARREFPGGPWLRWPRAD